MITGTAYGVALNHIHDRDRLAGAFTNEPYSKPPVAPVVYIKPRNCFAFGGSSVLKPLEIDAVAAAATIGILFGSKPNEPVAIALALDISAPGADYYRPSIRHKCRDGFLPVGRFSPVEALQREAAIITEINGHEADRWQLFELERDIQTLLSDLSAFMTLGDGDLLLIGVKHDAPMARLGDRIKVGMAGLPSIHVQIEAEEL